MAADLTSQQVLSDNVPNAISFHILKLYFKPVAHKPAVFDYADIMHADLEAVLTPRKVWQKGTTSQQLRLQASMGDVEADVQPQLDLQRLLCPLNMCWM